MMKWCCLLVFIICTIGVSKGGTLSGKCLDSNGKCGEKNVPCNETFGPEWTYNGNCCSGRPCCKLPCVPETCPNGFKLLSNQTISANCYSTSIVPIPTTWNEAFAICSQTDGAYMWRPNNQQEAKAVLIELNIPVNAENVWTGANDLDQDGIYEFAVENGPFSLNNPPFGIVNYVDPNSPCAGRLYAVAGDFWYWEIVPCGSLTVQNYICEYKLRVCP